MRKLITVMAMILWLNPAYGAENPAGDRVLKASAFTPLPLGAVRPQGWLKDQLTIAGNGLTGHLCDFWKDVGENSAWRGGSGEAWERGPYYLDGLVPLAYLLEDQRLIEKTRPFIEHILSSSQPNGWFGPAKNSDRWPLAVASKVLMQYYEATGDQRALTVLTRYFDYLRTAPPDWPDKDWRGVRACENVLTAFWLYRRTGNADYLRVADSIFANSFDWAKYFDAFPFKEKVPRNMGHSSHVVNVAMAVKYCGLRYLLTGDDRFRKLAFDALAKLDQYHGQVAGRFAGDEHLAGKNPSQGTELCAVVEEMFSLAQLSSILGDASFGDRTEMLAYNALPGTCTPDFWAHQYDQQANQVLVTRARRAWTTNGDNSNLYGLEPNYGCCTSNMHQGWPKLVSHMWMAAPENGLAAVVYGPSRVQAKIGDQSLTIDEETDYPFDGTIRFTVKSSQPATFPLYMRIPLWTGGRYTLKIDGQPAKTEQAPNASGYVFIKRAWQNGSVLELILPMDLRAETRYNGAVSILRGPLAFSLKIGERFEMLKQNHETLSTAEWAVHPETPWNYGLIVDRQNPAASITVEKGKISPLPFAHDDAPVALKARGKLIPAWGLVNNSAAPPPASPAQAQDPAVDIELIPYGCTRLRVTEMPTVN